MRPRAHHGAAVLAFLFAVAGFAASSKPSEPPPAAGLDSISDALCGRGSGRRALATALDDVEATTLPEAWSRVKVSELELWLQDPICRGATATEFERSERRHEVLAKIGSWVEQAHRIELAVAAVHRFGIWQPSTAPWPASSECPACAELRVAATRVAAVAASKWPAPKPAGDGPIGTLLQATAKLDPLIASLCAAKPASGAQAEIEKSFKYYSWTAEGAKLLEVAALFEQSEIDAGCRGR
jgi:hypothetical protein